MRAIIEEQGKRHPAMQPQDLVKLCYQAAFGAEHLLEDREKAWQYFQKEWEQLQEREEPLYERISLEYCRINLAAWKKKKMPPEWLFRIFCLAMSHKQEKCTDNNVFGGEGQCAERQSLESLNVENLNIEKMDIESVKAENLNTEKSDIESLDTESVKAESLNTEKLDTENLNTESVKAESLNTESVKAESLGAEQESAEERRFQRYLDGVEALLDEGAGRNYFAAWKQYRAEYERQGIHPVHHSEAYRCQEHPAYRLADSRVIRLLPLLERAAQLLEQGGVKVIAIDGRSASGKTTAASLLGEILQAGIVHMDDFFLPAELRTEERLGQPGGNVHYERFAREVLPCLTEQEEFSYGCFDCSTMRISRQRKLAASDWRIVEGAYSMHPVFGEYFDISVFFDITPEEQISRIRERDGADAVSVFAAKWIPLEEKYIEACQIRTRAQLLV